LGQVITATFAALSLMLSFTGHVDARRALSEDELDQTNAAGLEVRIVSDEAEAVEVDSPDLFVNELFGQNEVITRVIVEIVSAMDFDFKQSNQIAQAKSAEDLEGILAASRSISMVVGSSEDDGGFKTVINNVAGNNQVETAINFLIVLPVGQAGLRGYSNPFAAGAGAASIPGAGAGSAPPQPANAGPQFDTPTTLGGAASLLRDLARQYPQAASGLQSGASTVQSFQK
jgi:hypothetical protein